MPFRNIFQVFVKQTFRELAPKDNDDDDADDDDDENNNNNINVSVDVMKGEVTVFLSSRVQLHC